MGIISAFLFLGSEGTIDAPRISGVERGAQSGGNQQPVQPQQGPAPKPAEPQQPAKGPGKLPVVTIIGSLPPESQGPVRIRGTAGEEVRFRVKTDAPVTIDFVDVSSGEPSSIHTETVSDGQIVGFSFDRPGQYPLFAGGNDVGVATFDIRR